MAMRIGRAGATPPRRWELPGNETMRLARRAATVVRVERGTVLVTREGDLDDHVLEPGDELVLPRGGRAVAWAFTDATISVQEALPARGRAGGAAPIALSRA